jgi:hypothetical protein
METRSQLVWLRYTKLPLGPNVRTMIAPPLILDCLHLIFIDDVDVFETLYQPDEVSKYLLL